ncbi:MAG: YihY/virulence factor BrkB family protein [Verrucomicrobia bacterium]|nr:YihY/virulence factor BrkB family protein [Verrucomicrobiota bacterium]
MSLIASHAPVSPRSLAWRTGRILLASVRAFSTDNVGRLGAALAFYTTVAVAPLLVLAIAVAGAVFKEGAARARVLGEIEHLAGPQASKALGTIHAPVEISGGVVATLIGVGTLVIGAFGVFSHLQDALNAIWHVPPYRGRGWWRRRLFSMATVMATGFLLLVSLIVSAALSWLETNAMERFSLPPFVLQTVNLLVSLVVITFLFAMIFKLLPDLRVEWRHVWVGAGVTALLFTAGKVLLGIYFSHAHVTSAYGAAGSLVVLLLWCYYAAQIVFLGAEFTRITALTGGGRDFRPLEEASAANGKK